MRGKNCSSGVSMDSKINSFIDFKEYFNLNDYYLKVGYNNNNEIIIILYNIELLNNNRYELKKGLESILNLFKCFKSNHISEIYKQIIFK